jgi:hypothetical protein
LSDDRDLGCFIHPPLVGEARSGCRLGVRHVQLWSRPLEHLDKRERRYKELPIEAKESFKGLESAIESRRRLDAGGASQVTHLGEREAAIDEAWGRVPDRGHHVLIRACRDRSIAQSSQTLLHDLSEQPCQGTYRFTVAADNRKGRPQRAAWMAVRFVAVTRERPQRLNGSDSPPSVSL